MFANGGQDMEYDGSDPAFVVRPEAMMQAMMMAAMMQQGLAAGFMPAVMPGES
jgi:hypothetical protein